MATIAALRAALGKLADAAWHGQKRVRAERRPRWSVPPHGDDDDRLLSAALDHYEYLRATLLPALDADLAATRAILVEERAKRTFLLRRYRKAEEGWGRMAPARREEYRAEARDWLVRLEVAGDAGADA